jgi:tetratricopeptide (TPR) repeat protein
MFALIGDRDSAEQVIDEADAIAGTLSDPLLAAYADGVRSVMHFASSEWNECLVAGESAAPVMREHGMLWDLASFLSFACSAAMLEGDFSKAEALANECEEICRSLGHWGALSQAYRTKGFLQSRIHPNFLQGFKEFIDSDREIAEKAGPIPLRQVNIFEALYNFYSGDWNLALENSRSALEDPAPGIFASLPLTRFVSMLAYLGRREEALRILDDKFASLESLDFAQRGWVSSAVEALMILGERERAAALYPTMLRMISKGGMARFLDFRLYETLGGLAAWAAGEVESAAGHFERALRIADELTLPIEKADGRRFFAEMLIERGGPADKEGARGLLNEAIDSYGKLRFPKHLEMAEAILARI